MKQKKSKKTGAIASADEGTAKTPEEEVPEAGKTCAGTPQSDMTADKKTIKRAKAFGAAAILLLFLLSARFLWFSVFRAAELSERSDKMKAGQLSLTAIRGRICDRTGIPLRGRRKIARIILCRSYVDEDILKHIAKEAKLDHEDLIRDVYECNAIYVLSVSVKTGRSISAWVDRKNVPGVSVLLCDASEAVSLAQHLGGYTDKAGETGVSGLEKFFDPVLRTDESVRIAYAKDALSQIMAGSLENGGYEVLSGNCVTNNVNTTLDYRLQKTVEEVIDRNDPHGDKKGAGFKGAVVISDVKTGEILTMVSRPGYDEALLYDGSFSTSTSASYLVNRAVSAYEPGSIFKIVDTLAWLETFGNGLDYNCTGSIKVDDRSLPCSSVGGHGELDLPHAFAYSCNPYFVSMAWMLGSRRILSVATRLGLGEKTGLEAFGISEAQGSIPDASEIHNFGDLANISLGQGNITATPVQINAIMAAIANDGIYCQPSVIKSISSSDGKVLTTCLKGKKRRVMSAANANNLKAFCICTVEFGTGRFAKYSGDRFTSGSGGTATAGKTGTAENGSGEPHAWFSGFFPVDDPQYAMTVFAENGGHGGSVSGTLFRKICRAIDKM